MHIKICDIKKRLIVSTKTIIRSVTKFEAKRVHTISEKGPWSVLFFGNDDFSLESLKSLHKEYQSKTLSRLEVVTVQNKQKNEVRSYALKNGITVNPWPVAFNITDFHIGVVVSFGHLIPENIINSFPFGMINVHGSLLPKWRGAAPIQHSIINGDTYTGVTIMNILPKKFDRGEIIAQEKTSIGPDETAAELRDRLAIMGADLLVDTLKKLPSVLSNGRAQNETEATYAPKLSGKKYSVTWDKMSSTDIYNLYRGLTGIISLSTTFQGMTLKLLNIRKTEKPNHPSLENLNTPGSVVFDKTNNALIVKCKDDTWISIANVVLGHRRVVTAKEFSNGFITGQKKKVIFFE